MLSRLIKRVTKDASNPFYSSPNVTALKIVGRIFSMKLFHRPMLKIETSNENDVSVHDNFKRGHQALVTTR